jgi:hypothetical protein
MIINVSLNVKIRKIIDLLLSTHRLSSSTNEMMTDLDEEKIRLQDYAFTQRFCLVIESYDKKRQRLIMKCFRHKKKTRNTRKLKKENRYKAIINVIFIDCRYRVKITHMKKKKQ